MHALVRMPRIAPPPPIRALGVLKGEPARSPAPAPAPAVPYDVRGHTTLFRFAE